MPDYQVNDNGIDFPSRTTDPSSPGEGTMWHRSDINKFRYHLNGVIYEFPGVANSLIQNIITPPTLTATADDYNPTGFDTCDIIRQDIDTNNRQITGLVAPPAGVNRVVGINNIGPAGDDIRFMHNDAGSVAANRFLLRDNGNRSIRPNETAWFWYDHVDSRWKPFNRIG